MIVCQEIEFLDQQKILLDMKETILKHTCSLLRHVQTIGPSKKEKELQAIEIERIEQKFQKRILAVRTSNETREIQLREARE